jgi:hypothetical protein
MIDILDDSLQIAPLFDIRKYYSQTWAFPSIMELAQPAEPFRMSFCPKVRMNLLQSHRTDIHQCENDSAMIKHFNLQTTKKILYYIFFDYKLYDP